MKKLFLPLFLFILSSSFLFSQSCLSGGITFNNQTEIDNFSTNYPGCTTIEGDVKIDISQLPLLTNVDGLSQITSIMGDLRIFSSDELMNLSGLSNLTFIGGNLSVFYSDLLTDLSGLDNLNTIGGYLWINGNAGLENIMALNNLSSVGGDITISGNDNLINLQGLENLTSVNGELRVGFNDGLTGLEGLDNITEVERLWIRGGASLSDLTGLEGLTSISGNLWITSNDGLTSLNGLNNLEAVENAILINNNNALETLAGLENLQTYGASVSNAAFIEISNNNSLTSLSGIDNITDFPNYTLLRMHSNSNLSTCEVESICNLMGLGGGFDIYNNATGCNSEAEINDACATTGGPCPGEISGFTTLGEFGNSKYYLSDNIARPGNAQTISVNNNGYLAVINSQAENDFIQQHLSEMAYIGLSDEDTEGVLEWQNGSTVDYTNFDICGFCNDNSDELDFVMMHPWNGGWSWSSQYNQRKFIMEIPCGASESADLSLELVTLQTTVAEDDQFTITLFISNNGPSDATNILVQYNNTTTNNTTLLNQTISLGTVTDVFMNIKNWNIPILLSGESAQVELLYQADVGAPGFYYALAEVKEVDQDDPDSTPGNGADVGEDDDTDISIIFTDEGGGCPGDLLGFTTLGEYGSSKYYVSNSSATPTEAQTAAENLGGYLAVIGDASENNFIQQGIDEMVFIGLNDFSIEQNLAWVNGEPVNYTNFEICEFCNDNSTEMDFVMLHPWDGGWSWTNIFNARKYVIEIPCGTVDGVDLALEMTASVTSAVIDDEIVGTLSVINNGSEAATNIMIRSWRSEHLEFVDATPDLGTFTYDYYLYYNWEIPLLQPGQTAQVVINYVAGGSPFGGYSAGGFVVELDQTDVNPNNDMADVFIEQIQIGGCPLDISGFTTLGKFGNYRYYLSDDIARPMDAQAIAESHAGDLVVIENQEENDFIQQHISEMVYIGLNDYEEEGTLAWINGDPVDFTNFDICNFCNDNTEDLDFAMIHPWNGGWSWSSQWNQRRFVMEISCAVPVPFNSGNALISINEKEAKTEPRKLVLGKVFPNPAENVIYTSIRSAEDVTIELQIFDVRGQLQKMEKIGLHQGENTLDLNIAGLPAGMYFLMIPEIGGKRISERFVKVRD